MTVENAREKRKCLKKIVKLSVLPLVLLSVFGLIGCDSMTAGILAPKGPITFEERKLFFDSLALMLIVVIPVFIMSFTFMVRYRAEHKTADYKPNWGHSFLLEMIWWGVPCGIIIVLGIMTWTMTHKLDPYRKIDVPGKPLLIQAVALPWKWLFIYPEQNIATVNFIEIAKGQQVEFWLTNDNVPMSAFFVPQLGSQIYTMAGMRTRLHLLAFKEGTFEGLNTQYNGKGFAEMYFNVKVVEPSEFQHWVSQVRQSNKPLSVLVYRKRNFLMSWLTLINEMIMRWHAIIPIPKRFFRLFVFHDNL